MKESILAIIPARSGSKGLKDKNIKLLGEKPLLAYTIEAAIKSDIFSEIHVSTDSDKYAEISKGFGAKVPFLRTAEHALDESTTIDTVRWIIDEYNKWGITFQTIAILQPTSPFRNDSDIIDSFEVFKTNRANVVISVSESKTNPLWSNTLPDNNSLLDFINKDVINMPRQKLKKFYSINGAIYIMDTQFIMENDNFYQEKAYAYIMPQERSVDIDDDLDFKYAEVVLKSRQ